MKLERSRKSRKGRIEIIPMIDVMFFLLATFMLASLAMQKVNSLPVNLPQGKAQAQNIKDKITLTIDQNNQLYINKSAILNNNLQSKIAALIASGFSDEIIINADRSASHGAVTEAMLNSKAGGAKHFAIMVKD